MIKWLALIAALLVCIPAQAQQDFPRDIKVCWTNADSYEDTILPDGTVLLGGPIDPGDLVSDRIEIYRQNDPVPALTATIPALGEGLKQCEIFTAAIPNPGTYRIEGYSVVVGGIESEVSESIYKKYIGKPRSITEVIVEEI